MFTRKVAVRGALIGSILLSFVIGICGGAFAQRDSSLFDLGDAPDKPFPTRIESNGVRHELNQKMWLGAALNYEINAELVDLDRFDDTPYGFGTDNQNNPYFEAYVTGSPDSQPTVGYLNVLVDTEGTCSEPDSFGWRQEDNHVVRNEPVPVVPGQAIRVQVPALSVFQSPSIHWLRITLSDKPVPLAQGKTWDGSMLEPFFTGETEDHCDVQIDRVDEEKPIEPTPPSCEECQGKLDAIASGLAEASSVVEQGIEVVEGQPDFKATKERFDLALSVFLRMAGELEALAECFQDAGYQEYFGAIYGGLGDFIGQFQTFVGEVGHAVEEADKGNIVGAVEIYNAAYENFDQSSLPWAQDLLTYIHFCPESESGSEEASTSVTDSDGDGVADAEDLCPDFTGAADKNGC